MRVLVDKGCVAVMTTAMMVASRLGVWIMMIMMMMAPGAWSRMQWRRWCDQH